MACGQHTYLVCSVPWPSPCHPRGLLLDHCTATHSLSGGACLVLASAGSLAQYLALPVSPSGVAGYHFWAWLLCACSGRERRLWRSEMNAYESAEAGMRPTRRGGGGYGTKRTGKVADCTHPCIAASAAELGSCPRCLACMQRAVRGGSRRCMCFGSVWQCGGSPGDGRRRIVGVKELPYAIACMQSCPVAESALA